MSTETESLLYKYNKESPYNTAKVGVNANNVNKLGTWSYANMYDALYDKFSRYKNFDINMWRDALKYGEQDQYLAFLERSKDTTFSDKFYDPQYYDYESMMLEMYLPFANDTNAEKRYTEVYDANTGKWIEEEIGEMSDRAYIEYQLNNSRAVRSQQITRDIEQWRKDQLGWWGQLGHSALATGAEFGEGLLSALTGLVDTVAAVGSVGLIPYATEGFQGNYLDAFVEYFGSNGLTALEKNNVRAALDEYERTHTFFRDIDGNITGTGTYFAGVANSIGMMIPAIVTAYITGGTSLAGTAMGSMVGPATFYSSVFAVGMYEAANNPLTKDSPAWLKIGNVAVKAAVEAIVEYALGKVTGGTIQNRLLGMSGGGLTATLGKITGWTGAKYVAKSAILEGLEEFLQDFSTNLVDQFTELIYEGYGNNGVTAQTLIDSFFAGVLSSLVMSGGQIGLTGTKSMMVNANAKRKGLYDTELNIGPGDVVIEVEDKTKTEAKPAETKTEAKPAETKGEAKPAETKGEAKPAESTETKTEDKIKVKKLHGWNKLYYSNILSDFKSAIEELKRGKITKAGNLELAQEVYAGISTLTQYYASFDETRIKNCEMLLDRIAKAETRAQARTEAKDFGTKMEGVFQQMLGGVSQRHAIRRAVAAALKKKDKLEEGNVSNIDHAIDVDGNRYKRDPAIKEVEEALGKPAADKLAEICKGYEWVFVMDGCTAVEEDKMLFISGEWLKNFELAEIYKFLNQSEVLEVLITDKDLIPMVNKLTAFIKEFTKKEVTAENAMMEFLFNENVYQAFLLSRDGDNMHEFKDFIFKIHERVKAYSEMSEYTQRKFNGAPSQKRLKLVKEIYHQIRNTMCKPTLKAIINWKLDPQMIGADSILNKKDREFVKQYQEHQRTLASANEGTITQAYENLAEDILDRLGHTFTKEQFDLIKRHLAGKTTGDEDIDARLLLDAADLSMTVYDYEAVNTLYLQNTYDRIQTDYMMAKETPESNVDIDGLIRDINYYVEEAFRDAPGYMDSRNLGTEEGIVQRAVEYIRDTFTEYGVDLDNLYDVNSDLDFAIGHLGDFGTLESLKDDVDEISRLLQDIVVKTSPYRPLVERLSNFVIDVSESYTSPEIIAEFDNWYKKVIRSDFYRTASDRELELALVSGLHVLQKAIDYLNNTTIEIRRKRGLGALTIPVAAAEIAMNTGNTAEAQFVADKLNEFVDTYGIDAKQMIRGDLTGMSVAQRDRLTEDMMAMGIEDNNYVLFVQKRLENMFGNKYVVTPTYLQYGEDYSVMQWDNHSKNYEELSDRLSISRHAMWRWARDNNKKLHTTNEDTAYRLVEDFYDVTAEIQPNTYSDFEDYITPEMKDFWAKLGKLFRGNAVQALSFIVESKNVLSDMYETIDRALYEQAKLEYTKSLRETGIYDFVVAKSIPAEGFITTDILDLSEQERDDIFRSMFNYTADYDKSYETIIREMYHQLSAPEKLPKDIQGVLRDGTYREELLKIFEPIIARMDIGEDVESAADELLMTIKGGYDPYTGKVFADKITGEIIDVDLYKFFRFGTFNRQTTLPLSDFIDITAFPDVDLSNVTVEFSRQSPDEGGHWSAYRNCIVVNNITQNFFGTLVHEFNHCLQDKYNLLPGFNWDTAGNMPDFLAHLVNHYPEVVKYKLAQRGYRNHIKTLNIGSVTAEDIKKLPKNVRDILALCGYMAVTGELWARGYMHNGKMVRGYSSVYTKSGYYLISPDGKTKFKINYAQSYSPAKAPAAPSALVNTALLTTISNVLDAKEDADLFGYSDNENIRNTYHTRLTRESGLAILSKLVNRDMYIQLLKQSVSIDNFIKDPSTYLSEDILQTLNGDLSEGNVYYQLKNYVEANFEGISIDRDGVTHKYVFVDDDAFDDLIVPSKASKSTDFDGTDLIKDNSKTEGVPLDTFYRATELRRLGITDAVKVFISPNVKTETVRNKQYPRGAIFIHADEYTSNAALIDKLNHEFRHLMQLYNQLETGFTPNFKVTKEMIADVKAHIPELFDNRKLLAWADKRAKKLGSTREEEVVKGFVYFLTHGELSAYGFAATLLSGRPIYVTYEAGNPTIFLPWYNSKTGEGRWKTEYVASRSDDDFMSAKERRKLINEFKNEEAQKKKDAADKRGRYAAVKEAKGTNLEVFKKNGSEIQLEPRLRDFIVATTGNLNKLPPALAYAIETGNLTMQAFEKWFREAKASDINTYTFNLINKYIYKNDTLTTIEELETLLKKDVSFYWAAIELFIKKGLRLDEIVKQNDVHNFVNFINLIENSELKEDIRIHSAEFYRVKIKNKKGDYRKEELYADEKALGYMRVFAMEYFNGSLSSAYRVGQAFRKALGFQEFERTAPVSSLDATIDEDGETSVGSQTSEDDIDTDTGALIGNDILALYEHTAADDTDTIDDAISLIMHEKYLSEVAALIKAASWSDKMKTNAAEWLSNPKKLAKDIADLQKIANPTDKEKSRLKNRLFVQSKYKSIMKNLPELRAKLKELPREELIVRSEKIRDAKTLGVLVSLDVFDLSKKFAHTISLAAEKQIEQSGKSKLRKNIVGRIHTRADKIIEAVKNGDINFDALPKDIQDMFETVESWESQKITAYELKDPAAFRALPEDVQNLFTKVKVWDGNKTLSVFTYTAPIIVEDKKKRTIEFKDLPQETQDLFEVKEVSSEKRAKSARKLKELRLKQDLYRVGYGRVKLPGKTDVGGQFYGPKHDINKGNEAFRHDTGALLEIESVLDEVVAMIKNIKIDRENDKRTADKELREMRKKLKKTERELASAEKKLDNLQSTDFEVSRTGKKKNETSDTPNNFTIVSPIEMPEVLRDILDISFTKMADTRVQYLSKDKDGRYYDKETMEPQDFDSALKHEVANWDLFCEAARSQLLALTRKDALDIIDFIRQGAITLDGPTNKLQVFKTYLLAYILEAAKTNELGWDFSAKQIEYTNNLLESIFSLGGTILKSADQVKKFIDPMKKVRDSMLDDWISMSDADKDEFTNKIDAIRNEPDKAARNKKAKEFSKYVAGLQKREFEQRIKADWRFWSKEMWTKDNLALIWDRIKSFRYLFMLSGPYQFIRNNTTNTFLTIINGASDIISKFVFLPKAYRKDQWNLNGVKVTTEVKDFIDEYIYKNDLFKPMYNMQGKYDELQKKKYDNTKELWAGAIAKAYERGYVAKHRFDTKVMNVIAMYTDFLVSDTFFIKFATNRYFAKMLTIEVQKGNVNLSGGLSDKVLNLFADAAIAANTEYMHKRSPIATLIENVRGEHPALYELLTIWQPFVNTSFNWWLEFLKLTPVGLLGSIVRYAKLEARITKLDKMRADGRMVTSGRMEEFLARRDIGKGIIGLIGTILGLILYCTGRLGVEEDDDKFYIIAGDAKVDVGDIIGSSSIFMGVSIAQVWMQKKNPDGSDIPLTTRLEDMLSDLTGIVLDGFFFNDILERHKFDGNAYEVMITETDSVLRSFVPQLFQTIVAHATNDKIRYSDGLAGLWERWVNSWVPTMPAGDRVINPYTGEVQSKWAIPVFGEALKKGLIFGTKIYWYELDEGERMSREFGVNKNELTAQLTVNNVKHYLDREKLNTYYGQLNKGDLAKIKSQKHTVEMPNGKYKTLSWDAMNDEQRARVIDRIMTQNAQIAKIYIWTQNGHKYYASDSLYTELRKLGIKNVYKGDKGFVE